MGYANSIPHKAGRKSRTQARAKKRSNRGKKVINRAISPEKARMHMKKLKGQDDKAIIYGMITVIAILIILAGIVTATNAVGK